jgi:hypothetical protein
MRCFCKRSALLTLLLVSPPAEAQPLFHELVSPNEQAYGYFGMSVAGVPDVDDDGRGDLLVGAYGDSPGASPDSSGRAYVFSGASGVLLYELASPNEQLFGRFGGAAAGVSDLDGDGRGDLLVGAYYESPGTSPDFAGRAYVFSGASGALLYELRSPSQQQGGNFGTAVAGVPDVDGDGLEDLAVGAPDEAGGCPGGYGRVHVFSGGSGVFLRTFRSPSCGGYHRFGAAVAGVPDLDGDGRGDLLLGSESEEANDTPPLSSGKAYVFSGASGAILHELISENVQIAGFFGNAVAGVPDVDGDGVGDLLVGAYGEEDLSVVNGNLLTGKAYVFSGATGDFLYRLSSPNEEPDGRFAHTVAGLPDVDGDERGDLLIGSQESPGASPLGAGRAHVFSGATGDPLYELASPNEGPGEYSFSTGVAGVPDVNGNGRADVLVSARSESPGPSPERAGRAYVFGGSADRLTLSVSALAGPVPRGDSLRLAVTLTNVSPAPLTLDLRLDLTGPDGFTAADTLASALVLPAGTTVEDTLGSPVGTAFPLGTYTGTVTALEDGVLLAGAASFAFEVVEGTATEPPSEGSLAAVVAPNPASGRAAVAFTMAAPGVVRVVLYDVLGRAVATTAARHLEPGRHRLALGLASVPAGVYVWRLTTGERLQSGRLTVVR